jgi:hypothetical protein
MDQNRSIDSDDTPRMDQNRSIDSDDMGSWMWEYQNGSEWISPSTASLDGTCAMNDGGIHFYYIIFRTMDIITYM